MYAARYHYSASVASHTCTPLTLLSRDHIIKKGHGAMALKLSGKVQYFTGKYHDTNYDSWWWSKRRTACCTTYEDKTKFSFKYRTYRERKKSMAWCCLF